VTASAVGALNLDPIDDETRKQALDIVAAVREGGEVALLELATRFKDLPEGRSTFREVAAVSLRSQ
jgi:histidinol dehydrogenase